MADLFIRSKVSNPRGNIMSETPLLNELTIVDMKTNQKQIIKLNNLKHTGGSVNMGSLDQQIAAILDKVDADLGASESMMYGGGFSPTSDANVNMYGGGFSPTSDANVNMYGGGFSATSDYIVPTEMMNSEMFGGAKKPPAGFIAFRELREYISKKMDLKGVPLPAKMASIYKKKAAAEGIEDSVKQSERAKELFDSDNESERKKILASIQK